MHGVWPCIQYTRSIGGDSMAKAADIYRRMQRETVPDEASMSVLLSVLCESILVGREAMDHKDYPKSHRYLLAAQQTLLLLRAGIPEGTDEVGENLGGLYAWAERTLGHANSVHDSSEIGAVVTVLRNIGEGFEGLREGEVTL